MPAGALSGKQHMGLLLGPSGLPWNIGFNS
uniref:Uncharacterized protein n=1 Tax=Arundo donax TaxID=35708 RepID=A0A0A8XTN9_ARUDO